MSDFYILFQLRQRSLALDKGDAEAKVESKTIEKYVSYIMEDTSHSLMICREWNAASLQLTSDLADICNPATTLGLANFDDGFIGLAGTLSSLLGVYSAWKKSA